MNVTRLFDLLDHYRENYPDKTDAFANKINGEWKTYSAKYFIEQTELVSYGLIAIGLEKGQTIATLSNNRPEWNFLDLGMMQVGGIHVPIYPTIAEADLKFILEDAEVKYIFVSDEILWNKVNTVAKDLPNVKGVFSFDVLPEKANWSEILEKGKQAPAPDKVASIRAGIGANDMATILYTSGTTGVPKGVMLSHNNIISQIIAATHLAPVEPGPSQLVEPHHQSQ